MYIADVGRFSDLPEMHRKFIKISFFLEVSFNKHSNIRILYIIYSEKYK